MLRQLEGARLGIFIFLGTVLLVFAIFLLGSKERLFATTIEIRAFFNQIEGLKPGSPVRLSGYDIGSVSGISMASDTTGRVEVKMRIDTDLKHFIRIDSQAAIETEGLVGKKIVTITPGNPNSAEITDDGIISSKDPVNVAAIIEQTESVMENIEILTKDFAEIFAKINQGEGSIGKLVNDDQLYKSTVNITQTADRSLATLTKRLDEISDIIINTSGSIKSIIVNVDSTLAGVRLLVHRIDRGEGALGKLIADKKMADSINAIITNLTDISASAKNAASSFSENMEALKHNWLFKSYFEQRGYWNQIEYQKSINMQLIELKKQQDVLDKKIKELKEIETRLQKK